MRGSQAVNTVVPVADRPMSILVVDDERAHVEAIKRAFQSCPNIVVESASTLGECRETVAARPPDLALVDINLPDGRAFELLTVEPRLYPIVVMTSYGNEQTAVEAMKAGAIDYVVKSAEAFADTPHIVERALREWKLQQKHILAERALRASEEQYRTLFQGSSDALMTLAPPTWHFTSGNPAALAMFAARDEAEFTSRAPWQYSPERQPDGRASSEKAFEKIETAMRDGSLLFEWTHRRITGEDFPATVLLTRITLNGVVQLQATVRDESETKKLQASMAQADRLATMGTLAASVAHEINNPLAYVRYNIESLAQDLPRLADATQRACLTVRSQLGDAAYAQIVGDDAEVLEPVLLKDTVDRIREALEGIERVVAISRNLGAFSRVQQTKRTSVDVNVALEAAVNMAQNEIRHRARLIKDLGQPPAVWASESKLSQVFLNLLINAAHAIDEGDEQNNRITIRSWSDRGEVCVEIADTGKGISPENLARIFDPFFTTKAVGAGSGLGLSISRNVITEFNGTLSVTSEVGKGSRFVVRLPVESDAQPESRRIAEVDPLTVPQDRGRILVVEDEAAIRRTLERMLSHDHEIVAVSSGQEGQALVAKDSAFDVILCDLMMTGVSGIEFHAWLAGHQPRLADRLVFITGGAFTPKAREYLASVGNFTIQKPFDVGLLRQRLAEMVRVARGVLAD